MRKRTLILPCGLTYQIQEPWTIEQALIGEAKLLNRDDARVLWYEGGHTMIVEEEERS